MSTIRFSSPSAWTTLSFSSGDYNALANGSGMLETDSIATGLDLAYTFEAALVIGGTLTAQSVLSLFFLPLLSDGSTYGDGTVSGTTPPGSGYYIGSIWLRNGATSGAMVKGTVSNLLLPQYNGKIYVQNNLGVAFNSASAFVLKYSTVDLSSS